MMGAIFFSEQWKRLTSRFGDRALDDEFQKLAWREVSDMSDYDFREVVNTWIGDRPHHKPPLLSDFRSARQSREKQNFTRDLQGAAKTWGDVLVGTQARKHLDDVLEREFGGGVRSIKDAFEVARMKERVKLALEESQDAERKAALNCDAEEVLEF